MKGRRIIIDYMKTEIRFTKKPRNPELLSI